MSNRGTVLESIAEAISALSHERDMLMHNLAKADTAQREAEKEGRTLSTAFVESRDDIIVTLYWASKALLDLRGASAMLREDQVPSSNSGLPNPPSVPTG